MNKDYAKLTKLKTVGMVFSIVFDIALFGFCCVVDYMTADFIIGGENTGSMILYLILYTILILATVFFIKSLIKDIKELKNFNPIEYAKKLEQEDNKELKESRDRFIQEATLKDKLELEKESEDK